MKKLKRGQNVKINLNNVKNNKNASQNVENVRTNEKGYRILGNGSKVWV